MKMDAKQSQTVKSDARDMSAAQTMDVELDSAITDDS